MQYNFGYCLTKDLESFQKRLDLMLRECTDISLTFCNGLDFRLLPGAYATYDTHPFEPRGKGFELG